MQYGDNGTLFNVEWRNSHTPQPHSAKSEIISEAAEAAVALIPEANVALALAAAKNGFAAKNQHAE